MRLQRLGVTVVLASLALGVAIAGSSARATDAGPALRVRSLEPVSLRGIRFEPAERVTVTLNGLWHRRSRANAAGTFVVTFWKRSVSRCDGYTVKAVGSMGSRAGLSAPPPECASVNPG